MPIMTGSEPKAMNGGWMSGAVKHPGALHRTLGVPAGQKIPAAKLERAEHSPNPLTRKRASLAETFRNAHHADGQRAAHHPDSKRHAYRT